LTLFYAAGYAAAFVLLSKYIASAVKTAEAAFYAGNSFLRSNQ
jgi:hypothetical protein